MGFILGETFLNAYFSAAQIPWRIYGNDSHKRICTDYGFLKNNDTLDDLEVVKCTKKTDTGEL